MKILTVRSTFPPHYYGGGEISAYNLASILKRSGHEVSVATMADKGEKPLYGEKIDGLSVWRLPFPRPYAYWNHVKAPKWLKPLWYLQDHFDPRNRKLMASILDATQPDCVLVHVVSGMGYNCLREVGKRDIPTVYFMHDLNLACLWGGMFKNGRTCEKRCLACRAVSAVRFSAVTSIRPLAFCSPSRANLEKAATVLPLHRYKTAAIFNANKYPTPTVPKTSSDRLRFLYVGRLHYTKGIDIILGVLEKLAERYAFTIEILGEGADGPAWKERFGKHSWCRFRGHVSQQNVSDAMAQSDVLLTPSIWPENLPGVVIHALTQGLPVLGSAVGGVPELIEHDKNGLLLPAGDAEAWGRALEQILSAPEKLRQWSAYAQEHAYKFDQDVLGRELEAFVKDVAAMKKKPVP